MRHFLPIKGPGGRNLTTKEKVALVVLSLTLIFSVLTLLAGNDAFGSDPARNPVFGLVGAFARPIGVGILALYGVVLLWSGLIFFKGERAVRMSPLPGRALAAFGAAIGISGLLGIAQLDAAGELGQVVGGAIGHTFGAFGFLILLAMMALGAHLAGQGAWTVLRGSSGGALAQMPPMDTGGGGFSLPASSPRMGSTPMLPDDGDPSADERTLAITQAMDEIERSQGVRIVEVQESVAVVEDPVTVEEPVSLEEPVTVEEPVSLEEDGLEEDGRRTIGEAVEALPEPEVETEEAQVQRCLDAVASALHGLKTPEDVPEAEEEACEEEEDDEVEVEAGPAATLEQPAHGYVSLLEQEEEEEEEEEEPEEEAEYDEEEADEDEEIEEDEDELEEEDDEEEWDEEEEDDEDVEEEKEEDDDDDAPPQLVQPYLFPVAKREVEEEEDEGDEAPESESDTDADPAAADRETNFDWRGRPLE